MAAIHTGNRTQPQLVLIYHASGGFAVKKISFRSKSLPERQDHKHCLLLPGGFGLFDDLFHRCWIDFGADVAAVTDDHAQRLNEFFLRVGF